ncbi:CRISPR-associated endonuclease Cas2 [Gordonia amarae]|uniref:CRISPR-associated endoribonuclease Cas2 n=2 Tax=Gordonia amarae TaxID=36821 RepID=G7GND9_9ACTN|nr:CRISPR-associated endonuclease Cas2 [Gordonia amarae]MCS3880280.1 CRISPR-associated protein Cas2 [Gordonia amarae]QHN18629.1 CRISPR-associated endonuclease Cas2 [Gordonia amarae]QHN23104.1 CRISPR-associated endonuclease Cas2 [Gordonia amarae]QHN32005.1 CRISPR-associated endonuclease Cas2 [Gordonia amarae]QHN40752.1 CRISPR-associated endonuclease Cas2 [Gordonia amarae]
MARRRHLIAYDICEPRRLRQVCKVMEAYGTRLQYSVFLCDLSELELVQWRSDIHVVMDYREDSVVMIDLGTTGSAAAVTQLGKPRTLPTSGTTVL